MTNQPQDHSSHAFISYRHSDGPVVEQVRAALEPCYPIWRDTIEIRGGQVWRENIVRAIDSAYAMILVVSTRTEESQEVYAEYFYALGCNVPVIPLLIEETGLPFDLGNVNARLWYRNPVKALEELRDDLDHYRHRATASVPADDVQTYLGALKFNYLMAVENYTPMAGVARFRPERTARCPQAVVMRPEFSLRKSSPLNAGQNVNEEVRSYEDLLPALHQLKRVVILGEPGIGKTTTLFKFADELRQRSLQDPTAPVPVIVPLREWHGDATWKELVTRYLGGLAHRYEELMSGHRLYLLLDGLNEIPRDLNREEKISVLKLLLRNDIQVAVTCRELDYRDDTMRLGDLDTISIHPLTPKRVLDFLRRYLTDFYGEVIGASKAEELFWQIAGGAELKDTGEKRRQVVISPDNLMYLAANPYLLWMFLNIYLEKGTIPSNRGALFDEFVFQLFKRENLAEGEALSDEGNRLSDALGEFAWRMQTQVGEVSVVRHDVALTLPRRDVIQIVGTEEWLYRAASANILEDAEQVRFTHQLLQEYFTARRMLKEIRCGCLDARDLWPAERWWESRGWEEAAVLAAGMGGEQVFEWLLPVNSVVAALAINRSGVVVADQIKLKLRTLWLPGLTDIGQNPAVTARAAIGRALVSVILIKCEQLDNRPGIGLTAEGLPEIQWVDIPGGTVKLEGVKRKFKVADFRIARYPVTNMQFQVFVEAADGYRNPEWWNEIEQRGSPRPPRWGEANCPRESVSWYEAVAFCRWLTRKYHEEGPLETGKEIRLPSEWEWQQAATQGKSTNEYPWGSRWDASRCNIFGSGLNRTTVVGIYPHGTWPGGPLDLSGNVWEWCLNQYNKPAEADAVHIDTGGLRVMRGGSWGTGPWFVRSAYRSGGIPNYWSDNIGFRLAQDL